jgi:hypothetical protein
MKISLLILFFLPFVVVAQTLKGQVVDSIGEPIPFAHIKLENSTYGTVANGDGKFILKLTEDKVRLVVSAFDFITETVEIQVSEKENHIVVLKSSFTEIEEVVITKNQAKDRAKEIMKEVIDRRAGWDEKLDNYDVNLYSFTSIEQQIRDSIRKDSIISKKKLNINELYTHSYYKNLNQYKDSILGIIDLSEKSKNSGSVSVSFGTSEDNELQPQNAEESNPYLFVQGLAQADINLFKNQQLHQEICQKPLISPLAYNAFVYYNFRLERSFYNEKNEQILEINVIPRFKEEALYEGKLYIKDLSFELISAELRINKGALNYFKELHILIDYESLDGKLYPVRKEFIYLIKEGKTPPDFRVALTPHQCQLALEKFPSLSIEVQSSPIRKFTDQEYRDAGIAVVDNISQCDVLIGVKEVPIDQLISNKTYLFFSHTIKKQPYNAKLLRAILDKKITLIDYEVLKDAQGKRVIGFGRYAGIVGVFEGFNRLAAKLPLASIQPGLS